VSEDERRSADERGGPGDDPLFARPADVSGGFAPPPDPLPRPTPPSPASPAERAAFGPPPGGAAFAPAPG